MKRAHVLILIGLCALSFSCSPEPAPDETASSRATPTPATSDASAERDGESAPGSGNKGTAEKSVKGIPGDVVLPADGNFCEMESEDPIVAIVNEKITIRLSQVLQLTASRERRFQQAGTAPEMQRGRILRDARNEGLDRLVDQQRIYLESLNSGLEPTEDEVWEEIYKLTSRQTYPILKQLDQELKQGNITQEEFSRLKREVTEESILQIIDSQGWSRPDFDDQVQKLARVEKMMKEKVYADIMPTTPEMELHYRQNKETLYKTPARADIFRVEMHANDERTLEQTREQIEEVRDEVQAGLSGIADPEQKIKKFIEYIREYSDGPNVRGGGYVVIYGTEARGELEQSTIDMAYAVEPYTLSPVFDVHNGYSFLMVKKLYPRVQQTFAEMKQFIRNHMVKERREQRTKDFYAGLEDKYPVEICEDNLYVGLLDDVPENGDGGKTPTSNREAGLESGAAMTGSP